MKCTSICCLLSEARPIMLSVTIRHVYVTCQHLGAYLVFILLVLLVLLLFRILTAMSSLSILNLFVPLKCFCCGSCHPVAASPPYLTVLSHAFHVLSLMWVCPHPLVYVLHLSRNTFLYLVSSCLQFEGHGYRLHSHSH